MSVSKGKRAFLLVLLLIAAAAFAGGGCTGSSSGGGGGRLASAALDELDGLGVPSIFGGIDGLRTDDYLIIGKDSTITLEKVPSAAVSVVSASLSLPERDIDRFTVKGLRAGVRYTIDLAHDLMTPIQFSPSISIFRILDAPSAAADQPTPDADSMLGDASAVKETDAGPIDPEYLEHIPYNASTAPEHDPAIIAATFTAPADGDYLIRVINAYTGRTPALDPLPSVPGSSYKGEGIDKRFELILDHLYIFRIYEERGATPEMYGTPVIFTDDAGRQLTMNDMIKLRRSLLSPSTASGKILKDGGRAENEADWQDVGAPLAYDAERGVQRYAPLASKLDLWFPGEHSAELRERFSGFPVLTSGSSGAEAAKAAYSSALESMSSASLVSGPAVRAAVTGSRLDTQVIDLPYTNEYSIGLGIDAATGFVAQQYVIGDTFAFKDELKDPVTFTTSQYISTKEENEEHLGIKNDLTVNVGKVAVNNQTEFSRSIKYSNLSTTLWLHYDMTSQGYQDMPNSVIELTPQAKADIARLSASEFRAKYGDYFISGVRTTAQYDAFIAISTSSVEKVQEIKNNLKVDVSKVISNKTEVENQIKQTLSGTNIAVSVRAVGQPTNGSWVPFADVTGAPEAVIPGLLENMQQFMKASLDQNNFKFGKKFLKLRRLKSLPECESLPEEIDIEPELFKKMRTMTNSRLDLIAKYHAVADIPQANLIDGEKLKKQWSTEFDELMTDTSTKLNEISKSVRSVEEWTKKLDDMANKFSEISQRWSFYRSMMREQIRERDYGFPLHGSYDDPKEWQWGYDSFPWSSLVHNSVFLGRWNYDYHHDEEFLKYFCWEFDFAPRTNQLYSYVWIKSKSNKDDIKRNQSFTIGSDRLKYYFEGGTWRQVTWWLSCNRIDISDKSKWPFVGLLQAN